MYCFVLCQLINFSSDCVCLYFPVPKTDIGLYQAGMAGEPFQRRVPIFIHLEPQNIWRAKTRKKYWLAILIAYNITFLYILFCFTFSHVR